MYVTRRYLWTLRILILLLSLLTGFEEYTIYRMWGLLQPRLMEVPTTQYKGINPCSS